MTIKAGYEHPSKPAFETEALLLLCWARVEYCMVTNTPAVLLVA